MKHIQLQQSSTLLRSMVFSLSLPLIVLILPGCGGTSGDYTDAAIGMHSQMLEEEDHRNNLTNGNQPVRPAHSSAHGPSIASSFTMEPMDNFRGFNPEIWNKQQAWTECNCGNSRPLAPEIMTWNPAG